VSNESWLRNAVSNGTVEILVGTPDTDGGLSVWFSPKVGARTTAHHADTSARLEVLYNGSVGHRGWIPPRDGYKALGETISFHDAVKVLASMQSHMGRIASSVHVDGALRSLSSRELSPFSEALADGICSITGAIQHKNNDASTSFVIFGEGRMIVYEGGCKIHVFLRGGNNGFPEELCVSLNDDTPMPVVDAFGRDILGWSRYIPYWVRQCLRESTDGPVCCFRDSVKVSALLEGKDGSLASDIWEGQAATRNRKRTMTEVADAVEMMCGAVAHGKEHAYGIFNGDGLVIASNYGYVMLLSGSVVKVFYAPLRGRWAASVPTVTSSKFQPGAGTILPALNALSLAGVDCSGFVDKVIAKCVEGSEVRHVCETWKTWKENNVSELTQTQLNSIANQLAAKVDASIEKKMAAFEERLLKGARDAVMDAVMDAVLIQETAEDEPGAAEDEPEAAEDEPEAAEDEPDPASQEMSSEELAEAVADVVVRRLRANKQPSDGSRPEMEDQGFLDTKTALRALAAKDSPPFPQWAEFVASNGVLIQYPQKDTDALRKWDGQLLVSVKNITPGTETVTFTGSVPGHFQVSSTTSVRATRRGELWGAGQPAVIQEAILEFRDSVDTSFFEPRLRELRAAYGMSHVGDVDVFFTADHNLWDGTVSMRRTEDDPVFFIFSGPEHNLAKVSFNVLLDNINDKDLPSWARECLGKVIRCLPQKHQSKVAIEMWSKVHGQGKGKDTNVNITAGSTVETPDSKSVARTIVQAAKTEAQEAAMRTAVSQLVKLSGDAISASLHRHLDPGDPSMRVKIAEFMKTPMGNAMLRAFIGGALTAVPLPLPEKHKSVAASIARELRVSAMSVASDELVDVVMGPLRDVMSFYLQGLGDEEAEPKQLPSGSVDVPGISVAEAVAAK